LLEHFFERFFHGHYFEAAISRRDAFAAGFSHATDTSFSPPIIVIFFSYA